MNWYEDYGVNVPDVDDQQKDLYRIFDDLYDAVKETVENYWLTLKGALWNIRYFFF